MGIEMNITSKKIKPGDPILHKSTLQRIKTETRRSLFFDVFGFKLEI